jgi:spore maturation protein CgeB
VKVLLVRPGPGFSVQDVAEGWLYGLRAAGATVYDYNLEDRIAFYSHAEIDGVRAFDTPDALRLAAKGVENALYEVWPDVVVVISGFFFEQRIYELMRSRGHCVVLVHTESPYQDDEQVARAAWPHINLVNDPTNLDRFGAVNRNSWYIPHAYHPEHHHPRPGQDECRSDFCFVGTGYPSRVAFFEQVDWGGIDVALAGNWQSLDEDSPLRKFLAHDIEECCDNADAVNLYTSTEASANLYRREAHAPDLADGWAMGPREVELAACGTFYLTEARGENRAVLPMVPTFDGPGDFADKLRWYLSRPDERAAIVEAARQAIAGRSFVNNARELLRLLGN